MRAGGIAAAGAAALLCVVGLAVAVLTGVGSATRYLEQAGWSQRQSAAVSAIEAAAAGVMLRPIAARGPALAVLRGQIRAYRLSIRDERAVHAGEQRAEAGRGARLAALVERATTAPDALAALDQLRDLVGRIGAAERAEGRRVEQAMAALRRRMLWLGIGLAAAAAVLGGLAWGALAGANRRLARLVAVRTQEADARAGRLAEIDRTRRLFFAKLSHELRTPVTVLRGEAEVALRIDDDAGALRDALGHVVASAGYLERRLEELLGIASAEDGRLTLDLVPFDLGALICAVAGQAGPFARSSAIRLDVDVPDVPVAVVGDARWIRQAVLALVDNAVKFSFEDKAVALSLRIEDAKAVIAVADRGVGLGDIDPARMFEAYHQSAAGRARGGVGLGLALAAWIVEQHGGRIAARAREEGGCVIRIELPVAA